MPLAAEGLSPTSSDDEIQAAISASIKQCVDEGREQDQCIAMAYSMAKKSTGKKLTRLAMTEKKE